MRFLKTLASIAHEDEHSTLNYNLGGGVTPLNKN